MSNRFTRDGFAHLPGVVSAEILEALRAAADRLDHAASGAYGAICHNPSRRDGLFIEVARDLGLGAGLRWFQDHLIAKPPRGEAAIAWHQDYSYWPLDRPAGLTAWIALDDAGLDAGCLEYVPGSHARGERRAADFTEGAVQPPRDELAPIPIDRADRRAVAVPVAAGDALLHDPLVWHRSGPNRTDRPRRAWSISWIDPASRWDPDHAPHPFLIELAPVAGAAVEGPWFAVF